MLQNCCLNLLQMLRAVIYESPWRTCRVCHVSKFKLAKFAKLATGMAPAELL